MSDVVSKYERALQRYESYRDKVAKSPEAAPVGFTQESRKKALWDEMNAARNAVIAAGEWKGPLPIKLKQKYRGRIK